MGSGREWGQAVNDGPGRAIAMVPGAFHYARLVQFAETDLAGIVHFSWYFKYMEEAEHALWRAAGLSVAADGIHWPRVNASCEFLKPLRFEDEIDVTVRAGFGRRSMHYELQISRAETIVCRGTMMSVCARIDETGALKTIAIPAEIRERLRAALR
jgi:YbgC/YbaW family acyl-CoA thioester hydrolase